MRISERIRSLSLAVATFAAAANLASSQTNVNFVPAGPATWNNDGNWNPAFRPEATLNEIAVIGAGMSAFVVDSPPSPGGIVNSGSLEIRNGGNLSAVPGTEATVLGNLALNGTGALTVRRGGTLSVQGMNTSGTSLVTLGETGGAGTASLQVTGGTLNGGTRVIGPNVSFVSSGSLTFTGTSVLQPVITGNSHSLITASGSIQAGGLVRPEFSGYTPVLGDAWDLATGASLAGQFTLDDSLSPLVPRGSAFEINHTSTTATLQYTNKLILQVNRGTGSTSVLNAIGSPLEFDGYTITSASGSLGGTWNSLEGSGTWEEADNVSDFRLTEFNPGGSSTVNVGGSLALGTPFLPEPPSAFGELVGEDLAFSYTVPIDGATPAYTTDGIIEYVGGQNNLVLTIDPATGQAAIQNESPFFDVAIDAYTIESADGRLKFANGQWNSLDDQNLQTWEQADNVSSSRVTEFNRANQTALAGDGTILNLGSLVNVAGDPIRASDFTFEFSLIGGELDGDYNGDGVVNAADYTVWRDGGSPDSTQAGYNLWKANFGDVAGVVGGTVQGIVVIGTLPSGAGAAAAVPEPSAAVSMLLVCLLAAARPLRRRLL